MEGAVRAVKEIDFENHNFPETHLDKYTKIRGDAVINLLAPLIGVAGNYKNAFKDISFGELIWLHSVVSNDAHNWNEHKWARRCAELVDPGDYRYTDSFSVWGPLKPQESGPSPKNFVRAKVTFVFYFANFERALICTRIKLERRRVIDGAPAFEWPADMKGPFGTFSDAKISLYTQSTQYIDRVIWADEDPYALEILQNVMDAFWEDIYDDAAVRDSTLSKLLKKRKKLGVSQFLQELFLNHIPETPLLDPMPHNILDDILVAQRMEARLRRVYQRGAGVVDGIIMRAFTKFATEFDSVNKIDISVSRQGARLPTIHHTIGRLIAGDAAYAKAYRTIIVTYVKTATRTIRWDGLRYGHEDSEVVSLWKYAKAATIDPVHAAAFTILHLLRAHMKQHKSDWELFAEDTHPTGTICEEWLNLLAYKWWYTAAKVIIGYIKSEGAKNRYFGAAKRGLLHSGGLSDLAEYGHVSRHKRYPRGASGVVADASWAFGLVLTALAVSDREITKSVKFANQLVWHAARYFENTDQLRSAIKDVPFTISTGTADVHCIPDQNLMKAWVQGTAFYYKDLSNIRPPEDFTDTDPWDTIFMVWPNLATQLDWGNKRFCTEFEESMRDTSELIKENIREAIRHASDVIG